MNIKALSKEPTDVITVEIDWSDWLGIRTITTSTWTVPSGITKVTDTHSTSATFITLSGGTWANQYEISNHIVASDASEQTRSITVRIQQFVAYCTKLDARGIAQGMTTDGRPPATDELVSDIIERVSRAFDLEVGVPEGYFNPPLYPFATSKTFYGDGTNYLKPDPYLPGTLDANLTLPDGYSVPIFIEREGYLVITLGGNISIPGRSSIIGGLPTFGWYQGVPIGISAQWGFPYTPTDVKLAVIEWVINVWRETDPAGLKLVGLDGQVLREAMPPRVIEIRDRWQMKTGILV